MLIRKTLIYGDAYVIVWTVDSEDSTEDEAMVEAGVSLAYNSPLTMRLIYDPNNERKPLYAIKSWKEGKKRRADLYYQDYVERWITFSDNKNGHKESEWTLYKVDIEDLESGELVSDNGIVAHDFGEIPVIHFRTDLTYGNPEAIDGYNPQRAINKALATLNANIEKAGYPSRYFLMEPGSELDSKVDSDPDWDGEEVATQTSPQSIKDTPGSIQRHQGVKAAGEWTPANPSNFIDPINSYLKYMSLVTETPAYELNPSGDQPSGEARRQADKPLESKVANRQAFLRGSFAALYRLALRVADNPVSTVEVQWAPTSPISDSEGLAVVAAKQEAGVPVGQTLLEMGYSQEQVTEWLDNVAEAVTLEQRIDLMAKIATTLKDLGAASTLEAIDKQQVNDIVAALIASFNGDTE